MSTRCAWPGCTSVHPSESVTVLVSDGWACDEEGDLICATCDQRLRDELEAELARLAAVEECEPTECFACRGTGEGYGGGCCGYCDGRGTESAAVDVAREAPQAEGEPEQVSLAPLPRERGWSPERGLVSSEQGRSL